MPVTIYIPHDCLDEFWQLVAEDTGVSYLTAHSFTERLGIYEPHDVWDDERGFLVTIHARSREDFAKIIEEIFVV